MRASFSLLGIIPLVLTACVSMTPIASSPTSCQDQGGVSASYKHTVVPVDAAHLVLNTRFQLNLTPGQSMALDFIYLVNGRVVHRVNNVTASCLQPLELKQSITATAGDAVSVIFTRSIREKLDELNRALSQTPSVTVEARPFSEAETFQDASWRTAPPSSGKPAQAIGATSRVHQRGEPDNVISNRVLPSGTALELAVANWVGEEVSATLVCFNNRSQILIGGEWAKQVRLRPEMVDRFPLALTLETGLNYVQCYSLRVTLANGEPAYAWPPIFAAFVQGPSSP